MRVFGLIALYLYITDCFIPPQKIFRCIKTIHDRKIFFLKTNAELFLNVTKNIKERRHEILSLILENKENITNENLIESDDETCNCGL